MASEPWILKKQEKTRNLLWKLGIFNMPCRLNTDSTLLVNALKVRAVTHHKIDNLKTLLIFSILWLNQVDKLELLQNFSNYWQSVYHSFRSLLSSRLARCILFILLKHFIKTNDANSGILSNVSASTGN